MVQDKNIGPAVAIEVSRERLAEMHAAGCVAEESGGEIKTASTIVDV
ncbi:MAG: hypothetical protein OXN18_06295 [Gemmatimonadota bacterium]|nr:hypothetical protein [Gemmatimonadota bacterium]